MESMEIDKESNGNRSNSKENVFNLKRVAPEKSGEGLPYAPVNWPKHGDVWSWRVGRRIAPNGHFMDRYLYVPPRLSRSRKRTGFASKLAVERYIRSLIPDADIGAFFASFSWRIPAKKSLINGSLEEHVFQPFEEMVENSESDSHSDGVACIAGNKKCKSLMAQEKNPSVAAMPCDICCSEPCFCRECCCILCCKTTNSKYGEFNYIKCESLVSDGCICGHVAHVDCALRTYMAGTVGGSIGLDVEYYCRRCDAKTDLIPHVTRLLETCESIDSCEQLEKMLTVGTCILRGSQKYNAKTLLNRIESAISKLKSGTSLEDIWRVEKDVSAISTEQSPSTKVDVTDQQELVDNRTTLPDSLSTPSDIRAEILKLEEEIDDVLYELRKSQASEYRIAEERLFAQKKYLVNLYQQLEKEKWQLARQTSGTNTDVLLKAVLKRGDQIQQEVAKLKDMEEVARGFGRTSKSILKEHFRLEVEE
ncbi:protein OBERON 2 [Mercurialis annua]|uniref:protein OBERON 2 n=1 Tax=Mercurialis annua TaxID=3986 RepID=UPI00215F3983|nr:protein OBERON 2 [Mercurialis annua]XP_050219265.1 protein OBERON 2 [Mercurialis annua]